MVSIKILEFGASTLRPGQTSCWPAAFRLPWQPLASVLVKRYIIRSVRKGRGWLFRRTIAVRHRYGPPKEPAAHMQPQENGVPWRKDSCSLATRRASLALADASETAYL